MLPVLLVALSLANAAPATKTLTDKDNGKTVTITANQQLQIELSECGSCGYSWKTTAKPDPKVLTRRPQVHKDPTCQPPCTGGSYTTVFRHTGKAAGRTKLRLEYFGPGKSKASDSFRITVRVR
jgi:predicted secreted protein